MSLSDQLEGILHDLQHLTAEMALVFGALLVLIIGLFKPSQIGIKSAVAFTFILVFTHVISNEESLFGGMVFQSYLGSQFIQLFSIVGLFLLLFFTSKNHRSSYYFLLLMVMLGALMMMQSVHLLLIYLSIEMVSYGSYVLTNFSFNKKSHEAGIKYLLFGGVSSAIMLFGMSMLYGVSGSLLMADMSELSLYGQVGAVMLMVGVLFKVSAVPFHIWLPNVYQAAPTDTVTFFSIVPKLAGLVLLKNVLDNLGWGHEWLLVLGILTIVFGTFGALRQTNVRRLISYGAIAHTGFLMPFVILPISTPLFVWYAVIYALMNVGVFYLIGQFEKRGVHALNDYSSLGRSLPILGILMTVVLVALIGLPPTAGFTAKWILFSSLWSLYQAGSEVLILSYLLVAIFATAVALFYYIRVPYYLFIKSGGFEIEKPSLVAHLFAGLIALILLGLFFVPNLASNL